MSVAEITNTLNSCNISTSFIRPRITKTRNPHILKNYDLLSEDELKVIGQNKFGKIVLDIYKGVY